MKTLNQHRGAFMGVRHSANYADEDRDVFEG